MILGSPEHTQYDLRFRLFDIPVRIHPFFWLIMLLIGPSSRSGGKPDLLPTAVFVLAGFISILVHEFGHALSSRWLGRERGGLVLYAMGGFCFYEDNRPVAPWKRLVVLASGPGAGFLLLGAMLLGASVLYKIHPMDNLALLGIGNGDVVQSVLHLPRSVSFRYLFIFLLEINFWWGVFNLLPIWPLDGGQMTTTFLGAVNPRHGLRWGHVVSLLTAGAVAVFLASREQYWNAILVGSFGFANYQILQAMHDSYRSSQESDWGR